MSNDVVQNLLTGQPLTVSTLLRRADGHSSCEALGLRLCSKGLTIKACQSIDNKIVLQLVADLIG